MQVFENQYASEMFSSDVRLHCCFLKATACASFISAFTIFSAVRGMEVVSDSTDIPG